MASTKTTVATTATVTATMMMIGRTIVATGSTEWSESRKREKGCTPQLCLNHVHYPLSTLLNMPCSQEAENDLKQLAGGKGQKVNEEEHLTSITSPGTPARSRRKRCKRSPRAATASTLKPRRLFADLNKTGSTEGAEEQDDNDDDKYACLGDDNEDADLFNAEFTLSPRKKSSARKPKQRANPSSGKRKRAASKECLQETSEAEEPEALEEEGSGNAGTKEPAEDPPAQDPRSKFEPGLLELLLVGMNPLLICMCVSGVLAPSARC